MVRKKLLKKQVDEGALAPASTCFLIFSPPPFTGEGLGVRVNQLLANLFQYPGNVAGTFQV